MFCSNVVPARICHVTESQIILSAFLLIFSGVQRSNTMASLKSSKCTQVKLFELQNEMILQVDVSGYKSGHNAKVKLQLQNCSHPWILHWGCISNGNKKWFIPSFIPSGTRVHKKSALRTPFIKERDAYVVNIELRDPKIHAIEFVLKDSKHDKWLKMNGVSFHINLHEQVDVENDGARSSKCLLNEMSDEEIEKPLKHRNLCNSVFFPKLSTSSSTWKGVSQKNNIFSNMYAMSLEEACNEMVGEKSNSIRFLSNKMPAWIKFPASVVLPFGVFEKVLSEDINKELATKIACLCEDVDRGDVSKLKMIQETILQMKAPRRMSIEVRKKMKSSRIPWPQGPAEDTWNQIWQAIKKVWGSKWNERAYKNRNHDTLCIGILIQEHIRADYAFVTYTNHPVSRDSSQIYTEIVKGSVETLIGASPGRAMSSITKKSELKSPIVTCYPSKSIGLYANNKRSIIFRPDFISEKTNRYACHGIYDSILMENKEEVVLVYSRDPMVVDLHFQALIHSKIAEAAKIIEDLYECPQDIEGVVQDGQVYVIQCKALSL
ncbi:unnamed protein product [Lactuca saligna]|uniref:Pyruvate phosphate dikinase AMP/ATP-binding domain-containing protein n=1 Tax=Lactuca saligna TaxID=75948 RepID=A0AA35ZFN6_LACSI|nr:unnamed protein product [Lactuca saligna]